MGASASAIDVACCAKRQRDGHAPYGKSGSIDEQMEPPGASPVGTRVTFGAATKFGSCNSNSDEQLEPVEATSTLSGGLQGAAAAASASTAHQSMMSTNSAKSSVKQTQSTASADEDRKRAKEIEKASGLVGTSCLKFPLHQGSFFGSGGAKERFVAAAPSDEVNPDADWSVYVKRWRRGKLGYWADQQSFERKEPPKGCLDLLSITKVSMPEGGTVEDVSVKHRDTETGQVMRLVLRFPDSQKAEAWRVAMRTLRGLLQ